MPGLDPPPCSPPSGDPGSGPFRVLSVVIPNWNYAAYVPAAVESALQIDWPQVEVIVVDDGSTDDSIAALEPFLDRITLLTQTNRGPRVACNRGFAASRGDAVLFLDSDDVVDPALAREVAAVWHSGVSKVQVQMIRVGREGTPVGRAFPSFRRLPDAEQVRHWMLTTSAYPTPPGSGNVYSRPFLEQLFPLDDRCGDATDSACLAAAPFLGDVVTVRRALVRYRLHGENRSSLVREPSRVRGQIMRAYQRQRLAHEVAGRPTDDKSLFRALRRGRHLLQMRVAERRVCAGAPTLPGDGMPQVLRDIASSPMEPGPESLLHRILVPLWCFLVLSLPMGSARALIVRRFS